MEESGYREHSPHPALRPWVACYWTRCPAPASAGHRVLPDGCADILFDLTGGGRVESLVVGPMTRAVVVAIHPSSRMVAVRFRPGGARAFLGLPLDELRDGRAGLGELWPDPAALEERLAATATPTSAVAELERELRARLPGLQPPSGVVRAAIESLLASPAEGSVGALAREVGVSRQHLTRSFNEEIGHGPKLLARILRMQRAVDLASAGDRIPLAAVALDAGYYDQSHMNADFRSLAGVSPLQLSRAIPAASG